MDRINPNHFIPVSSSKFLPGKHPGNGSNHGAHGERRQQNTNNPLLVELQQPSNREEIGENAQRKGTTNAAIGSESIDVAIAPTAAGGKS